METFIGAVVVVGLVWLVVAARWPFLPCRRCDGTGQRSTPLGRGWRECGRCAGSGRRVRLGREVRTRPLKPVSDAERRTTTLRRVDMRSVVIQEWVVALQISTST